jgi:hypothetical protein
MKFPLGDIIRAIAKPGSWLARIFGKTKGISIDLGDHEIKLNEGAGPSRAGESRFDSKPHRPAPPRLGGR